MQALEGPGASGRCRNSKGLILRSFGHSIGSTGGWEVVQPKRTHTHCVLIHGQLLDKALGNFNFFWFHVSFGCQHPPNYDMAQILAAVYEVEHSNCPHRG